MQAVHADLDRLKGRTDPLRTVAAELAGEARVLCLDEMQVNDITDAMIMAGLLEALFARGVTLVTTSNVPPDGLYRAGLQRDRFLPAIALLQRHCTVLELASSTDYRLRRLEQAPVYLVPPGAAADTALARAFSDLAGAGRDRTAPLVINGREIPVVAWSDGVVQGCASLVQSADLLRKTRLPVELIPARSVLAAAAGLRPVTLVVAPAGMWFGESGPQALLWLPAWVLIQIAMAYFLALSLALLTAALRDIGNLVQTLFGMLIFFAPILFPLERVPEAMRPLLWLNPFTVLANGYHAILLLSLIHI